MSDLVLAFESIGMNDVGRVGGKNASLGEMISRLGDAGVAVPTGFATTDKAYWDFLNDNHLTDAIRQKLEQLDTNDVNALRQTSRSIREWILNASFSDAFEQAVRQAYERLEQQLRTNISVAVRSSATAEDLQEASFAGQQETFLNVEGAQQVLEAIKKVYASLFNERAISYRVHHNFKHDDVAISAGVQQMVRSDLAASGVIFTIDTESGFDQAVFVTGSYGLGEPIVQGDVNPDEFYVYKPNLRANRPAILRKRIGEKARKMVYADQGGAETVKQIDVSQHKRALYCLNDDEIESLARQALIIEDHYGKAMDVEWAKDGISGKIYIVQARPETVQSRHTASTKHYKLKKRGRILSEGRGVGQKIVQGKIKVINDLENADQLQQGEVLVTDMTDPNWEPVMKRAAAIITDRGGRTCHAAIVAREMGIPGVVGCGHATEVLKNEQPVTVSCAEGDTGYVYEGYLEYSVDEVSLDTMPELPVKLMLNVANPDQVFGFHNLPCDGVGLARIEFIINHMIGVHPGAILDYDRLDEKLKSRIAEQSVNYSSPTEFYIERLKEGIATIAAAFYPKPVIVRLSDFKSNEYANLLGGSLYEPHEENPMLGFRGASRYVHANFKQSFGLECQALKRARDDMGLDNLQAMVPFVRTPEEGQRVVQVMDDNGLKRGENNLKIVMMCEIPSNALRADQFLQHFDGFSIGSNDLTQLTLGLDRDSGLVSEFFDERDRSVEDLMQMAIRACREQNKYIGICGQGPSDHPDLAQWLIEQGMQTMSLNPDIMVDTWLYLAKHLNHHSKEHAHE